MFAVIKTGGKQYRVTAGDVLKVEKVAGEAGDIVEFTEVMMVGEGASATIGKPLVEGALVTAEVVDQGRGRKIIAFKKRRRQNSKRTIGHRQHFTTVSIAEILTGGAKPSKKAAAKPAAKKETAPKAAAKEAAPNAEKKTPAKKAEAKSDEVAPLFAAPEGPADDLKKISGVGPVLEKKLNALGVMTFAQVAAMSKDDIQKLDDALSFKGRIERDDWLSQAAELAKA
ncbi:50S ribosomal protein L21 [Lentilitoribacter sp. EG35]|uniref:50S ribosomal protein L21 n=1 Tax=Lentilitoribacter sp. EG35 TaxID=3234192 RepID=UPI00345F52D7